MLFEFPPLIDAGIKAKKYVEVFNSAGVPLAIARDSETGRFVGHAVGALTNSGASLNPMVAPVQMITSGAQMYQMHQGFQAVQVGLQSLQTSLGVLQATTAVIGVGVAANLAISGISLWQTLKLREDVKQLRFEVKEGFLDLTRALRGQGVEIIQRVEAVAQDVKFEQHRVVLVQAYGRFLEATKLIKIAMSCQDSQIRNSDLANARQILTEALADYRNPQLLSELCAPGQLRRFECAWAIEQTIALTYQLQNQPEPLIQCLSELQYRTRNDLLTVIDQCQFEHELDFLFPEIIRIQDHDLAVLQLWQSQIDWVRSLSADELQALQALPANQGNSASLSEQAQVIEGELLPPTSTDLPEQVQYKQSQQKSHPDALLDQLRFMISPKLRQATEVYVSEQAAAQGHQTLTSSRLAGMSNLAIANLYWYFKVRDQEEAEFFAA